MGAVVGVSLLIEVRTPRHPERDVGRLLIARVGGLGRLLGRPLYREGALTIVSARGTHVGLLNIHCIFFFFAPEKLSTMEDAAASSPSPPSRMVDIKSKDHFTSLMEKNPSTLFVIKFGATWCRPCQKIAPKFEAFANDGLPDIICACVDMTHRGDLQDLAVQVGATSIPFFALFQGGKLLVSQQTSNIETVRVLVQNTSLEIARCGEQIISPPK